MNNRLLFVVLTMCAVILSALIVRNGRLLLLIMPFISYLVIAFIQAPTDLALTAHRSISKANVTAEEPFEIRVTFENQGYDLINLLVTDTEFASMQLLEGTTQQRFTLKAGDKTELRYLVKATRGVHSWKFIHASASDSFGLFEFECDIPALGELLVRPTPIPTRSIALRPRATLRATGPIPARRAGAGTDFWSVREYQPGDSLRHLNWRLATRHPHKLFTNEYERSEIGDFGIIVDARKLTSDDTLEEALFEHSISAAATLSESFLKAGNRVALLTFGETITSLFPGYGKHQLNLVLQKLARVRLGGNVPLGYLEYFPIRLFPSHSQIIMFSTVDLRDMETYARLCAYGYEVLLISPDPIDYAASQLPADTVNTLAIRAARIERLLQLQRLMKLGVNVINWHVNETFEKVMNNLTRHSIHRRNIETYH